MKRQVEWQGQCIPYELSLKKVKNVNIRVRDGRVSVSAPKRMPAAEADRIVLARAAWLVSALERQEARPRSRFEPGGTVYLGGQALRLAFAHGRPGVEHKEDGLLVTAASPEEIRPLLRRYMEKEAERLLSGRLKELYPLARRDGVAFPALRLRWMTGRWGSCACTGGAITLNKALAAAPPACVDYVILHELCHFLHPDHSAAFYRALQGWMPDYQEARALLKGVSPSDWTP